MNIIVFDTETASMNKRFIYNLGYVVYDTETGELLKMKDLVISQVWHNKMLFATAYYGEKRPLYIKSLRSRKSQLKKWGFACRELEKDIIKYGVRKIYAFNSSFDESAFKMNCEWYKNKNPLRLCEVCDIRKIVKSKITDTKEYKDFCLKNELLTEKGNIKTSAESIYRYLKNDTGFIEDHTALSDSLIELKILLA